MSGYFIKIPSTPFIPSIGRSGLTSVVTSAVDTSYLDEKATLANESEKSKGVTKKAHLVSLAFTRKEINQTFNDLLAYAKLWLTLSKAGNGYALLKEAGTSQPELAVVKAKAVESLSEAESTLNSLPFSEESKAEYVFAAFDQVCSLVDQGYYAKLPYFNECCEAEPALSPSLGKLKRGLDSIKQAFKDEGLFQSQPTEDTAARLEKLSVIQQGLSALKPTLITLEKVTQQLKTKLPSDKQFYVVRALSSLITCIGSVFVLYAVTSAAPFTIIAALLLLGNETYSYFIKQQIKPWEELKQSLTTLDQLDPSQEKNMYPTLSSVTQDYHQVSDTQKEITSKQITITSTQQNQAQEMADLRAMVQLLLNKVEVLEKEKAQASSSSTPLEKNLTQGESANESKAESKLEFA